MYNVTAIYDLEDWAVQHRGIATEAAVVPTTS